MLIKCRKCGIEKPVIDFTPNKWNKRVRHADFDKARAKDRAKAKRLYWSNPEKMRAQRSKERLPYRYGLTLEDREAMLAEQNGLCAICKKNIVIPRARFTANVAHIDHDHKTGATRGLLCIRCNAGLGAFRDDIEMLKAAVAYLEFYAS